MRWNIVSTDCCNNGLLITQSQGDNTPTTILLPYDVTSFTFHGTVQFTTSILLALTTGITLVSVTTANISISGNVLTASAVSSGAITVGMPIAGLGILPGTYITGFGTGTGSTGTYTVNFTQTVASIAVASSNVTMQLTTPQTLTVPEGQYAFDLWQTDLSSINTPILTGFFQINTALTVI